MKHILITLFIVVISINITAQRLQTVAWYNWSNPTTFQLSSSPYITGYGYYSDSLSKTYNGVQFYVYNAEYYPIQSWADYYYWYVKKYSFYFMDSQLYEYYYMTKNDYGMASYIAGNNYWGRYYPTRFYLVFHNRPVEINRLCPNSRYIASNDKQIVKLRRLEILANKKSRNVHKFAHNDAKKPAKFRHKETSKYASTKNNVNKKSNSKEVKQRTTNNVNSGRNTVYRKSTNSSSGNNVSYRRSSNNSSSSTSRSSSGTRSNTSRTNLPKKK